MLKKIASHSWFFVPFANNLELKFEFRPFAKWVWLCVCIRCRWEKCQLANQQQKLKMCKINGERNTFGSQLNRFGTMAKVLILWFHISDCRLSTPLYLPVFIVKTKIDKSSFYLGFFDDETSLYGPLLPYRCRTQRIYELCPSTSNFVKTCTKTATLHGNFGIPNGFSITCKNC